MTAEEKIQFNGEVSEAGDIKLPVNFRRDVVRFFSGRPIVVTVERKRKKRSLNQNAYYWAVVIAMIRQAMNDAGENVTEQDVHEFLKFRFLRIQRVNEQTGELLYEYGRSTTTLKTFEFALYLDQCVQFAVEYLNASIPSPSTSERFSFPEQQSKGEERPEYLARICEYLQDITHRWQLEKYFQQNPDWKTDSEVRAMFNIRAKELS